MIKLSSSSILESTVYHRRNAPESHVFSYKLFYLKLNLGSECKENLKILRFNKPGIFSIYEKDYLSNYDGDLLNKINKLLTDLDLNLNYTDVDFITHPRFFGKVFNPVSFFILYRQKSEPVGLIAEVHNTFGEKHLYCCDEVTSSVSEDGKPKTYYFKASKEFHVSPFFSKEGYYEFSYFNEAKKLLVTVNLYQDQKLVFESGISSSEVVLCDKNLFRVIVKYPGSILLTLPRIMIQAFKLKFNKGLRVFTKPIADSNMTFEKKEASFVQKFTQNLFESYLSELKNGQITLIFPDGSEKNFGEPTDHNCRIFVKNYDLFLNSILHGDIGFGESYVDGHWETDNLVNVLKFFSKNLETANDRKIKSTYFGRIFNTIQHSLRFNNIKNSKNNISAHYDLSNDLFKLFLDNRMQYSSALFEAEESLEEAQSNKISKIIELANVSKGMSVLEVGCGWGGLAIELVKKTGCYYTGITLSQEQKKYFEERILSEGLQDKMKVLLQDYRHTEGKFDRIISIEMVEAVGHKYLKTYFSKLSSLLKDNGIIVIQAITIPETRYAAYKAGCDWIQKYIFPGGLCPSLQTLVTESGKVSLILDKTDNYGLSYAKTLHCWRERFDSNWQEISKYGFDDRFKRIWDYYLSYCEAGFAEKMVNLHQLVFYKQK